MIFLIQTSLMSSSTPVYLTDQEAKTFVLFQKYKKIFEFIEARNLLNAPESSFEIRIDKHSNVEFVDIHSRLRN